MIGRSLPNKRRVLCKRGFSVVVATIFMVLAVLFLYFNVFMFTQNQNIKLQDVVSQSQQLDADRNAEQIVISKANYTIVETGRLSVVCTFINNSPLPVEITRLWVQDYQEPPNTGNLPLSLVLAAGKNMTQNFYVSLNTSIDGSLHIWFVTSRGNSFSKVIER